MPELYSAPYLEPRYRRRPKGTRLSVYDEYLDRTDWEKANFLHDYMARRILKEFIRIASLRPESTELLEIGAGRGRAGLAARGLGFASYTGVEPNERLADFCRAEAGLKIIEESLPNLESLPDEEFGAAFSIHVLEHATDYIAAREWITEVARVLKPGGSFLIVAPDVRDYGSYFWDSDWSHGYPTSPRRVSQILSDLDLAVDYSGTMHLGRVGGITALAAHAASMFIPTRVGDMFAQRIVGRPLVSGLKIAALWGLTFVVGRKTSV